MGFNSRRQFLAGQHHAWYGNFTPSWRNFETFSAAAAAAAARRPPPKPKRNRRQQPRGQQRNGKRGQQRTSTKIWTTVTRSLAILVRLMMAPITKLALAVALGGAVAATAPHPRHLELTNITGKPELAFTPVGTVMPVGAFARLVVTVDIDDMVKQCFLARSHMIDWWQMAPPTRGPTSSCLTTPSSAASTPGPRRP